MEIHSEGQSLRLQLQLVKQDCGMSTDDPNLMSCLL
jgi:hypothetical protein